MVVITRCIDLLYNSVLGVWRRLVSRRLPQLGDYVYHDVITDNGSRRYYGIVVTHELISHENGLWVDVFIDRYSKFYVNPGPFYWSHVCLFQRYWTVVTDPVTIKELQIMRVKKKLGV